MAAASPALSRGRRVLGEKDKNMIVGGIDVDVDKKNKQSAARLLLSPQKGGTSSPRAGQKRKLDSVEEAGSQDSSQQRSSKTETLSTLTSLSDAIDAPVDSPGEDVDVVRPTLDRRLSQPSPSQSELSADRADSYFEIHEEMSQRSLDKLHAVSLSSQPANAGSSPRLALTRPSLGKENSLLSVSMSSLISLDEKDESQQQEQLLPCTQSTNIDPTKRDEEPKILSSCRVEEVERGGETDASRRAAAMAEKAQALRTRLQLAYYKVTTNQPSTPFSRLSALQRQQQRRKQLLDHQAASFPSCSTTTPPKLLSPPQLVPSSYDGRNRHGSGICADWRMAVARERAAAAAAAAAIVPTTPQRPTMTNRRTTRVREHRSEDRPQQQDRPARDRRNQGDRGNDEEVEEEEHDDQNDDNDYDDEDDNNINNNNNNDNDDSDSRMTSSVVKGEAADVLLRLNRGPR